MVSECGKTSLQISVVVPVNILTKSKGMAKPEWLETLKHRLEELKGVSDALWDSLEHRVGTLEVRIRVQGLGNSNAPQGERLIIIEKSQGQLGDTLKDLSTEVKDSIAVL